MVGDARLGLLSAPARPFIGKRRTGVIEPNKKTILKLNEILEPVSDEDLKAKVRLALPIVARAIAAARQAAVHGKPARRPCQRALGTCTAGLI